MSSPHHPTTSCLPTLTRPLASSSSLPSSSTALCYEVATSSQWYSHHSPTTPQYATPFTPHHYYAHTSTGTTQGAHHYPYQHHPQHTLWSSAHNVTTEPTLAPPGRDAATLQEEEPEVTTMSTVATPYRTPPVHIQLQYGHQWSSGSVGSDRVSSCSGKPQGSLPQDPSRMVGMLNVSLTSPPLSPLSPDVDVYDDQNSPLKLYLSGGGGRRRKRPLESGKPAYSYIALICMAISNSHKQAATLSEICDYIRCKFPYYQRTDRWRSSIRHNLTLNDCFVKLPKIKGEKGCAWRVDGNFQDMFDQGSLLRRRYRFKEGSKKWLKSRIESQKKQERSRLRKLEQQGLLHTITTRGEGATIQVEDAPPNDHQTDTDLPELMSPTTQQTFVTSAHMSMTSSPTIQQMSPTTKVANFTSDTKSWFAAPTIAQFSPVSSIDDDVKPSLVTRHDVTPSLATRHDVRPSLATHHDIKPSSIVTVNDVSLTLSGDDSQKSVSDDIACSAPLVRANTERTDYPFHTQHHHGYGMCNNAGYIYNAFHTDWSKNAGQ